MKLYRGLPPHSVVVVKDDAGTRTLRLRLDLSNHSPTGFSWGYGGSGPSQLALALLADVFEGSPLADQTALRFHQEFKWEVIAKLPMGEPWALTDEQIRETLYAMPCWLEAAKA